MGEAAEVDFEDRISQAEVFLGAFEALDTSFGRAEDYAVALIKVFVSRVAE